LIGVTKLTAQTSFCGSITKPVTVSQALGNANTILKLSDRFGNLYTPEELRIYKNPNTLSVRSPYVDGIFILTFQDIERQNGRGFNDPTFGNQRLEVVRQVFRELSDFLQTPSATARVRIDIQESATGSGFIALATPMISFPYQNVAGVLDNEVANTIISGVDSYIGLWEAFSPTITTTSLPHAQIQFNFPSTLNVDNKFHYDLTTGNLDNTKLDFYTIALHEAFHCLGFSANMIQNGGSQYHTRYASLLHYQDNGTPPLLTYNSTNNYTIFSTNGRTNPLNLGCGQNNGIIFKGQNLSNQPIFTPGTWSAGSSLSHFECDPDCTGNTPQQNVMQYCSKPGSNGVFRHPSQAEADALCDLGYTRKNTWGLNASNTTIRKTYSSCSVQSCAWGVNDRYEILVNGSIPITNALDNDKGSDLSMAFLTRVHGEGTLSNITSKSFTFTPANNYTGPVILYYVPVCGGNNNNIKGNITYIAINVRPTPCTVSVQPPCGQNLVCHGDFELTRSTALYGDFLSENSNNSVDIYQRNATGAFQTFFTDGTLVSSDFGCGIFQYPLPQGTNNNNRYLGIGGNSGNKEAATLALQTLLDPSKTYRLTFDAMAPAIANCNISTPKLRIVGSNTVPCTPPERTSMTPGTVLGCGFNPQSVSIVNLNTTTNWTNYTVNNITGLAINRLFFTGDNLNYVFIDNVKLEEINCPTTSLCQPVGYTAIGTSGTSVTVSALVTAGTLPNTYTQTGTPKEQLYIQGTLVVDRDYGFYDSHLKMAPGSRIVVNTGKLLDISQGTLIEGCDQMWKGIEFQGGAFIYVTNSTIKDAEYAVRILRNNAGETTIALNGSNFMDNYYNLKVEPTANVASHIGPFSHAVNCMFGNPRGNLKTAYTGQTNYDIKTFSGISVNDVASMGIYDCSFMSMDYGLLALGSNFFLQRNKFANMPRRVVPNADDRGGFAISITGGGSLFCYGSGANGTSAFDNVDVAIRIISALFKIEDCNITNCNYGIRVNNSAYSQNSTIKNNKFRVNKEAVRISQSGTTRMYIQNNDIAPNLDEEIQGIVIHENGNYNPEFDIRDNTIKVISRGLGLGIQFYGQNSPGFTIVSKNKIYLDNRTPQFVAEGISASYSGNLAIDNNYIEGIGQMSGYGIGLSDCVGWYGSSTLSCNGIDNLDIGMSFFGNNMLDQGLKFNRFLRIKKTGLEIFRPGSIIGLQLNTGNQWEFDGYTDFAAINSSGNLTASKITTNAAPNYFARNNISPSIGWFVASSDIPTAACIINLTTPVLQVRGAELTEEEIVNNPNSSYRTVAEGKNINQSEAIQNIANRQLLRFVEDKTKENRFALHGSFADFNTKVKNKLDKNQYEWDKDFKAASTIDNVLLSRFKENALLQEAAIKKAAATAQRIAELELRDKAAAATLATTDNTLANLMKERKDMEAEHSKKLDRAKAKLRSDNKNNRGQKLHETHESYVNEALLDLTEGKKMDKVQIEQLDIIANLCPSLGGVAVYKARSVLGSLIDQIGLRHWNDRKNCDTDIPNLRSNPIERIVSTTNTPQVLAFPNPANDLLKLSFYDTNASSEAPHTIQIFNTMGGVLKHIDLKKLQDTDIDTKEIPVGVYILKVAAKDGQWSKSLKISILR
jgi:Secretion system C-terminal sorting domain